MKAGSGTLTARDGWRLDFHMRWDSCTTFEGFNVDGVRQWVKSIANCSILEAAQEIKRFGEEHDELRQGKLL